ncbi:helix-turn-helix transcriptional regulator [Jiangella alkaliphila]|uniref:Proteasome accessory factor C n=1 Tax=Jiangella alkaliphila TaxID=419479 RepID=A0A1H2HUB3_9ACTN|nr:WYL domain-containing protein [Jiangella alkaliphila]SDU35118.1 proteasome accessory factor C [Jiangella alkaliphila]
MSVPPPVFVRRFERVTHALRILTMHPDGVPIRRLAAELDVDEQTLRAEIVAFYCADSAAFDPGPLRQVRIEFVGADGGADDVDPAVAEVVRASTDRPAAEIGVMHTSPAELAHVYRAGQTLLSLEPDNNVLDGALRTLGDTMLRGVRPVDDRWKVELAGILVDAIRRRRWVRIEYTPVWRDDSTEHRIAPYRLLRTRRGWEVDAGMSADGRVVGSFLLTGIREATVLDEMFERPQEVEDRLSGHRHEQEVELVVPQDARWAVDRFAESSELLAEDEESVKLRVRLLRPVERRLGILLLSAGPLAFVTDPPELAEAGRRLARELLDHHGTTAR